MGEYDAPVGSRPPGAHDLYAAIGKLVDRGVARRRGRLGDRLLANDGKSVILLAMKTVISTKGQLVLPAELRQQDGVAPGQEFEIERLGPGVYRLARAGAPTNAGLVDWLLACPEKGWFVPVPSESTADLQDPGLEEPVD